MLTVDKARAMLGETKLTDGQIQRTIDFLAGLRGKRYAEYINRPIIIKKSQIKMAKWKITRAYFEWKNS